MDALQQIIEGEQHAPAFVKRGVARHRTGELALEG